MIEDIAGGFFKVIGRLFAGIFIEVILEILIKGPGYFIKKLFSKKDPDPDGIDVALLGILFWLAVGGITFICLSDASGW